MPQILVTAESTDDGGATVLLRERITLPDLESGHFAAQLVERMGWALADADDLEHASGPKDRTIPGRTGSARHSAALVELYPDAPEEPRGGSTARRAPADY